MAAESKPENRTYIAHLVLLPDDGEPSFTLETEFDAENYARAWDHLMRLPEKFKSKLISHRMMEKAPKTGTLLLPHQPTPVTALTVNAPAPKPAAEQDEWWYSCVVRSVDAAPYPEKETYHAQSA